MSNNVTVAERRDAGGLTSQSQYPGSNPGGDTNSDRTSSHARPIATDPAADTPHAAGSDQTRPRRRMTVARELQDVDRDIKRAEQPTTDPEALAIRERALRRLYPRRDALALELASAPEDAPRPEWKGTTPLKSIGRDFIADPITPAEEAMLEIPAFLRRQKAAP